MSKREDVPYETTLLIRDTCLCLHIQRAARALARHFDDALRPFDLTNGQFSLIMSLNRPEAPNMGSVASLLGIDRTTLTAALKPLERRGLIKTSVDPSDRRGRVIALTPAGRALLKDAVPIWKKMHAAAENRLGSAGADRMRNELQALTRPAR